RFCWWIVVINSRCHLTTDRCRSSSLVKKGTRAGYVRSRPLPSGARDERMPRFTAYEYPSAPNGRRVVGKQAASVCGDHHVAGFDDSIHVFADGKFESLGRCLGDNRDDFSAAW